ncbi:MAG: HAD family hydrolase [Candidatus Bathyarchaeota archaeon]|nr:HAD family hydrolase [Candidatus Bathyarchaeota archaeon]
MIKCVIFDLDHTLVRLSIDWKHALESVKEIYRKHGIPESLLERYKLSVFSMLIEIYEEMLKSFPKNRAEEIQRNVWQVLEDYEIKGVAEAESVPNCKEVLIDLKSKGLKVGVVSASPSIAVTQALKKFDLEKYVDAVFTRDSPGRMKPSSDHVLACLKALNCAPQNAILVGDNVRDMQAARKAGVLAVGLLAEDHQWMKKRAISSEWQRRRKEKLEKSADITIQDLLEIESLLKLCQV